VQHRRVRDTEGQQQQPTTTTKAFTFSNARVMDEGSELGSLHVVVVVVAVVCLVGHATVFLHFSVLFGGTAVHLLSIRSVESGWHAFHEPSVTVVIVLIVQSVARGCY
jgi:hypothetical protein